MAPPELATDRNLRKRTEGEIQAISSQDERTFYSRPEHFHDKQAQKMFRKSADSFSLPEQSS